MALARSRTSPRGLLLPGLRAAHGVTSSLVASAAIFGLLHVPQYGIGALVVVWYGLVLGWARLSTGRLVTSIVLHGLLNGLMLLFIALRLR
jgi:membrane protease YdiL (CAAX protease family)